MGGQKEGSELDLLLLSWTSLWNWELMHPPPHPPGHPAQSSGERMLTA